MEKIAQSLYKGGFLLTFYLIHNIYKMVTFPEKKSYSFAAQISTYVGPFVKHARFDFEKNLKRNTLFVLILV